MQEENKKDNLIDVGEADESARLELISSKTIESLPPRKKDTKYTPLSLRQEKPFAILWLIKRYPCVI